MKRAWRLPILLLIAALSVTAIAAQNRTGVGNHPNVRLNEMVPTAAADDALSSTWYCAAGTATGVIAGDTAGFAEQTLTISNASSNDASGSVTAYTESGVTAVKSVAIGAHGQTTVRVSEILKAAWASALVEVSGGGTTVTHELRGPAGRSISACASSPGDNWYFPSGTTRAGSRNLLSLFNPFPGEATVDISFDTEDGARTPQQLQGMVVPGGRVVKVDVGAIVTLRERVTTTVHARIGRVIAEQIQTGDGRTNTEQGLTAVLGATAVAPIWTFPVATAASTSAREIVSVMNMGDADTEVQVEIQLDDPATNGSVEPFVVQVASHRSAQIDLAIDPRIPKSFGRWLIVRSGSGVPIVAERSIGATRGASVGGFAFSMGVPIAATSWLGTVSSATDVSTTLIAVANPSGSQTATVTISLHSKGSVTAIAAAKSVRIAPGQRLVLSLTSAIVGKTDASVEVESDRPVVVGQWMTVTTPFEIQTISDFPVIGTESLLANVFTPDQAVAAVTAVRSDDTVVPETTTTTAAVTTTTIAGATTTTIAGAATTTTLR
jgi:hypothetical protein